LTIAHTAARRYFEQGRLAASFFFTRGVVGMSAMRASLSLLLPGSWQYIFAKVEPYICDAITAHSVIPSQFLTDQWHQLVLRLLSKLDGSDTYPFYVVVIDALKECGDNVRMQYRAVNTHCQVAAAAAAAALIRPGLGLVPTWPV
jgi:hypothetical protein